ncbi:protein LEO1 homolog isoform X2 [Magnolia sinica]|uniref:protein LEO1 homolog isoform X2 n=1 Tax=Magnolia sinica TaxID=86752 RepID=UPI002658C9CF|nr:protein LEO1 homolog isoform X2 [Magnolia sinica]
MGGEEKRHQMMQNLFGDQSEEEEEDEEEELDIGHDTLQQPPHYHSDEGEGEAEVEVEGEAEAEAEAEAEVEAEAEAEAEVEGEGEAEVESEVEIHDVDPNQRESEGERVQSSPEREISGQRVESEGKEADSEDQEYGQRVVTSRRREVIVSGSERSEENNYVDDEDEEVDQASPRSPGEQKDHADISQSAPEIRDVFGDSDEDEPAEYAAQNDLEQDSHRSPIEEEGSYEKELRPEDLVPEEEGQYESEEENLEQKHKEKPVGPPLELEIPLRPPPGQPDKMNMIKVSNIMGIEPKPFDPKTYVEEDVFVTDESGTKKRIRLEDNIVRWRRVRNRDGMMSYESNARFVRWSDGSLQLLIGNEVLDISVQEAHHDQSHLFLRHGKGILQSQGRILRKMRFMPSSLSSKSHRLLTALVDSRHKKVYKVKNCVTNIDPEREKEEKEKAEGQSIRANELLQRKREKVSRKYPQTVERGRQLSPGFLEEALEEDDEPEDYYSSRRSAARHRFEEDMELEAQAEKRIINAKRFTKDVPRKSSLPAVRPSRRPVEESSESVGGESEYETDGDEGEQSPVRKRSREPEHEYDEDEQEAEETGANEESEEDEPEEPRRRNKESVGSLKRKEIESDPDSPPRKPAVHRRAVVFDSDED